MCILALAWRTHPRWPLVALGNRDELHGRSSAPLARWIQPDHVIGGRDLQSGGTWLGISEQGRFVAVTNRRGFGTPVQGRVSRGLLVADMLSNNGLYSDSEDADLSNFNPFNLLTVDRHGARFVTNRPDTKRSALVPGLYGLSNGALDEPWPKTVQLKASLLQWIVAGVGDPERLLDNLRIDELPGFGITPTAHSDVAQAPSLSPIFIRGPVYGTRCSTVVAVNNRGDGRMLERRFDADGKTSGETSLTFSWPA